MAIVNHYTTSVIVADLTLSFTIAYLGSIKPHLAAPYGRFMDQLHDSCMRSLLAECCEETKFKEGASEMHDIDCIKNV